MNKKNEQGNHSLPVGSVRGGSLDDYILAHIDKESDYLHRLWRATQLHLLYGRMASGHLQGRLLKMLVGMIRPKLVLEIGTYSGYSGLCIAEGLPEDGHLHTVEINDEQEDFTLPWFQNSPWADKITMHIGDALEVVPKLHRCLGFRTRRGLTRLRCTLAMRWRWCRSWACSSTWRSSMVTSASMWNIMRW